MAVVAGYAGAVITDRQLDEVGQDFRSWLLERRDDFLPLKILDVRPDVGEGPDREIIITLALILDASDRPPGYRIPLEPFDKVMLAVGRRQAEGDYPVPVYVRLESSVPDDDFDDEAEDD